MLTVSAVVILLLVLLNIAFVLTFKAIVKALAAHPILTAAFLASIIIFGLLFLVGIALMVKYADKEEDSEDVPKKDVPKKRKRILP